MKRLFLIFYGRFPSEKAASLFAAKSAESFAEKGIEVVLLVPRRIGRLREDPYRYYGVQKNFKIIYLPTLDLFKIRPLLWLAFEVGFLTFSFFSLFYLLFNAGKNDIIYSNESLPIFLASSFFSQTLYEVHDFPKQGSVFYKMLFQKVRSILVTNVWKREQLEQLFHVPRNKILCERNAVEIKDFDMPITKEEAREKLHLPLDGFVIVYTGHLYRWKGVDTLALAAEKLPADTHVFFVGGTETDVDRFRKQYGQSKNMSILGYRDHSQIAFWQKAADVLILPNTAKEEISKHQTSPMKLFEYMASKRPIVATDIPSIREVLSSTNAVIVPPDDSEAMAKGIIEILKNRDQGGRIAKKAYQDVLFHTWDKRAQRILDFVKEKQGG